MSRIPPPLTEKEQRTADRLAALRARTPDAIRAWATRYNVPLIGIDNDELLLISIHEARVELFQGAARRVSRDWLAANKARIVAEHEAE
jgi:hypothetical protein